MKKLWRSFLLFCYKLKRYDITEGLLEAMARKDWQSYSELREELDRINNKIDKLS